MYIDDYDRDAKRWSSIQWLWINHENHAGFALMWCCSLFDRDYSIEFVLGNNQSSWILLSFLIDKFDLNAMDEHRSLAAAASGPAGGNFAYSRAANFDEEENQNQTMSS